MMRFNKGLLQIRLTLVLVLILCAQCQNSPKNKESLTNDNETNEKNHDMELIKTKYATSENGNQIKSFRLINANGVEVNVIEFGAIVTEIKTPDINGQIRDITLGYDDLKGWENDPYYFGATIGRVANRTGGATFKLDSTTYELAPNTLPDFGRNHLHGGVKPFNKVVWNGTEFKNDDEVGVILEYTSPDGEEGYPGNLECRVSYAMNSKNELKIVYTATTDRKTIVNMTHHSYFNLSGAGNGTVLDQQVKINADTYTVADDDLIPTGDIAKVDGLPIDFKNEHIIGSRIDKMKLGKFTGYDLNYILNHSKSGSMDFAGRAFDPETGRVLEVYTTQPCMHFYTGNFLEGKLGKNGKSYPKFGAFCFEPQGYPDAINKPQFDSIILNPNEVYEQTIIYKFSTQEL